jgi:hypothetical protein
MIFHRRSGNSPDIAGLDSRALNDKGSNAIFNFVISYRPWIPISAVSPF